MNTKNINKQKYKPIYTDLSPIHPKIHHDRIWTFSHSFEQQPSYVIAEKVFSPEECSLIISDSKVQQAELEQTEIYNGLCKRSFRQEYLDVFDYPILTKRLENLAVHCNKKFFNYTLIGFAPVYNILEYRTNDETGRHFDVSPTMLTLTIALTDDYTGGELYIEGCDAPIKPNLGDCVLMKGFASHSVLSVKSGSRIVLIAWTIGNTNYR